MIRVRQGSSWKRKPSFRSCCIDIGNSRLILSEVTELENSKNPYYSVKIRIDELISKADRKIKVTAPTRKLARTFENAGLNGMDGLHLAAAI
jgi:hypothetical protein